MIRASFNLSLGIFLTAFVASSYAAISQPACEYRTEATGNFYENDDLRSVGIHGVTLGVPLAEALRILDDRGFKPHAGPERSDPPFDTHGYFGSALWSSYCLDCDDQARLVLVTLWYTKLAHQEPVISRITEVSKTNKTEAEYFKELSQKYGAPSYISQTEKCRHKIWGYEPHNAPRDPNHQRDVLQCWSADPCRSIPPRHCSALDKPLPYVGLQIQFPYFTANHEGKKVYVILKTLTDYPLLSSSKFSDKPTKAPPSLSACAIIVN